MVIMFSCAGIAFSSAGIFFPALTKEFGVGQAQIGLYLTISLLSASMLMPYVGRLMVTRDLRAVLSIGVICIGGTLIAFSFATRVWHFYAASPFFGLGFAICSYLAVPTLLNRWFVKRFGLVMGLSMAMSGLGGVVFNPIAASIIVDWGWQTGYRVLGLVPIVLALPLTVFAVRSYPSELGLCPYGDAGDSPAAETAEAGVSASDVLKSGPFIAMLVFTAFVGFGCGIYTFMPSYASGLPIANGTLTIAALLASAAMLGQALGKIGLGWMADKNLAVALTVSMTCGAGGALILWLMPVSSALVAGAGFAYGIFYAAALVLVPLMVRAIFGNREYSRIYSRISTASAVSIAAASTVWGFLIDKTGFQVLWIGGLGIMGSCLLLGAYSLRARRGMAHARASESAKA